MRIELETRQVSVHESCHLPSPSPVQLEPRLSFSRINRAQPARMPFPDVVNTSERSVHLRNMLTRLGRLPRVKRIAKLVRAHDVPRSGKCFEDKNDFR